MQLPGNGGPNGNPIQNNGGSVTKGQVNNLKISPVIVGKTAESTAAQIETILPTQPLIKQQQLQQQPPIQQPQQPPIQKQQHLFQQPPKSPSTNSILGVSFKDSK